MDSAEERLRALVEALCSRETAGRATGTAEGRAARAVIARAFGEIGVGTVEQAVADGGANLYGRVGAGERAILVGAHYDHLGRAGGETWWGADDNAAAVAIVAEVARGLAASPPPGRAVWLVAFDAEEPPAFLTDGMGSETFAREPPLPLDRVDLMVALDLCGHAVGGPDTPAAVRDSLFLFGAERSDGSAALAEATTVDGLRVRRAGINLLPPLSDYHAFERRGVPFLFATGGRWRHYHEPTDTPDRLDYRRIAATARWLERLVRAAAARPSPVRYLPDGRDDAATVATLRALLAALPGPDARALLRRADALADALAAAPAPRLTMPQFGELRTLLAVVESLLA